MKTITILLFALTLLPGCPQTPEDKAKMEHVRWELVNPTSYVRYYRATFKNTGLKDAVNIRVVLRSPCGRTHAQPGVPSRAHPGDRVVAAVTAKDCSMDASRCRVISITWD